MLDGTPTTIRMRPLRDVTDEQYVVYFMTAGTKPPQPPVVYCPHSAAEGAAHDEHAHEEEGLVGTGPPSPPAPSDAEQPPRLRSRGVEWRIDESGRVWPQAQAVAQASVL